MRNLRNIKITKFIILIMLIIMSMIPFVSCSKDESIDVELIDLTDYIASKIDLSDFINISTEKMQNEYNINEENTKQAIVKVSLNINSSEMLFFVEASDKDAAKEIENTLNQRKSETLRLLEDYDANPDNQNQYYIVNDSKMLIKENYIFWAVHSENTEINNIIEEFIKEHN